jgi:diaminopimelate decarboxylase
MLCDYKNGRLHIEDVDLGNIAGDLGTPCYVYSRAALETRWREYDSAFGSRSHRICYAVKANDNLSIINTLRGVGAAFDIVSGGELERVLTAGVAPKEVVFSGVGKTTAEIRRALECGIGCINVESMAELERIAAVAQQMESNVAVAVRVNPDVDAQTHPYISTGLKENKFGVPITQAVDLYQRIADLPRLHASGIACHIGSQLTSIAPLVDAITQVVELAHALDAAGFALEHVDVGGGLGICYRDEQPPSAAALVEAIIRIVPEHYKVVMEPGRSIVGAAGLLLTRVEYLKHNDARDFVIVDAAMNDLLRPALYDAWHDVRPYRLSPERPTIRCDVVGPVCESGDWLARDRGVGSRGRRSSQYHGRRCLWLGDGVELQCTTAAGRSAG